MRFKKPTTPVLIDRRRMILGLVYKDKYPLTYHYCLTYQNRDYFFDIRQMDIETPNIQIKNLKDAEDVLEYIKIKISNLFISAFFTSNGNKTEPTFKDLL